MPKKTKTPKSIPTVKTEAPAKATKPTKALAEKPKKISGLDAAFQALKTKGEPMTCKALIDAMLASGMWKTNGKTPAATLNAALHREIATKGAASRFKKTDRGLFAING